MAESAVDAVAQLREEFIEKAGRAFDSMFDEDQQEQLITLTQREDRILEKGAELQAWILEQHLRRDPLVNPSEMEALHSPKCRRLGIRDFDEPEPMHRDLDTRAENRNLENVKCRCPSCRTVFFHLRRQT